MLCRIGFAALIELLYRAADERNDKRLFVLKGWFVLAFFWPVSNDGMNPGALTLKLENGVKLGWGTAGSCLRDVGCVDVVDPDGAVIAGGRVGASGIFWRLVASKLGSVWFLPLSWQSVDSPWSCWRKKDPVKRCFSSSMVNCRSLRAASIRFSSIFLALSICWIRSSSAACSAATFLCCWIFNSVSFSSRSASCSLASVEEADDFADTLLRLSVAFPNT